MRHGIHLPLAGLICLLISVQAHAFEPRTVWGEADAVVLAVRYAPDGKSLIDVEADEKGASIRVLSHRTLEPVNTRRVNGAWHSAAVAPDGQWVAIAGVNKVTRLDIASGRQTDLALKADCIPSIAISNDSRFLATASVQHPDEEESLIQIWSVPTGKVISTCKSKGDSYSGVPMAFSPTGDLIRILECDRPPVPTEPHKCDRTFRLKDWHVGESRFVRSITLQKSEGAMATSFDGKLIALGSVSEAGLCRIRLVETEHYQTVKTLVRTGCPLVRLLEFTRDGTHLISCALAADSLRHTLTAWDLGTGQEESSTDPKTADPRVLACVPDGNEITIAGINAPFPSGSYHFIVLNQNGSVDFKVHNQLEIWRCPFVVDKGPDYAQPDPNVPIPLYHDEPKAAISSDQASEIGIREVIRREGWFGRADQPIRRSEDCWLVSVWHWPRTSGGVRIVTVGDDGKVRGYERGRARNCWGRAQPGKPAERSRPSS
jgi:hypothetical protein